MPKLSESFRTELRMFAFFLANGTVSEEILGDLDYSEALCEPSIMEMVFAIWANVIEMDESGVPTNGHEAQRRAAQYLRSVIDPAYEVVPPFEIGEQELL